jgi:hypothetical protein
MQNYCVIAIPGIELHCIISILSVQPLRDIRNKSLEHIFIDLLSVWMTLSYALNLGQGKSLSHDHKLTKL